MNWAPLPVASNSGTAISFLGIVLIVLGWRQIHGSHHLVTGGVPLGDTPRDILDALDRAHRGAAVFVNDQGHGLNPPRSGMRKALNYT